MVKKMSATNEQVPEQSPTRLRQIALVAEDLEKAKQLLAEVIGTEVIFVDPAVGQWGLKNILVAIGGDIIEVVSPFKPNTTASRLLSKRGDGGYMIIMQTMEAKARRSYLESKGLAKVIFTHETADSICVQYHPKGIKGGMMPELDSHHPTPSNPTPLTTRFSPWHACGPDYASYSAGMKRHSDLQFMSATCRLSPGDKDTESAAKQWESLFGVQRNGDMLEFTNMRLRFIPGEEGKAEGLAETVIGVEGKERLRGILEKAKREGLCVDEEGWVEMLGVRWAFVLPATSSVSKL